MPLKSYIILGFVFAGLLVSAATAQQPITQQGRLVVVVELENVAITPVAAQFIQRAIKEAESRQADCLVIVLDTPGGLVDSTRDIVKNILNSQVPIAVFVAPRGARAASAGVFITLAAHVAAMAPGTHIGAAYPVQIGGLPSFPPPSGDEKTDDKPLDKTPLEVKTLNDTVAWARTLAELRGRNAEWAERTVKESLSIPATEAVREHAIDLQAEDLNDLLNLIDGRVVRLSSGSVTLLTRGAEVQTLEMWWGERTLGVLSNPNVAFLLLIIGFYGILFELNTPGWGVGGTLGLVCLLLGLFALAVLPVNYAGLALIALALALFAAEVFVTSYGALTLAGVVCLVLGGLMLVDSPAGFQRVSLGIVIPVAVATAGITLFLVGNIVRAHRGRVQTGTEGMIGMEAVAAEAFAPADDAYAGTVRAHGELWKAISQAPVAAGETVEVAGRHGLTLLVGGANGREPPIAFEHTEADSHRQKGGYDAAL